MKIAIVGIQGLPNQYGGFENRSEFLVKYLGKEHEFTVYISGIDQKGKPAEYQGTKLKYYDITSLVARASCLIANVCGMLLVATMMLSWYWILILTH